MAKTVLSVKSIHGDMYTFNAFASKAGQGTPDTQADKSDKGAKDKTPSI
jgi:hypothetical protein